MWIDEFDLSRKQWEELIEDWILNEKYRAIVKRKWIDRTPNEKVAEEFDMSPRQIAQISSICKKRILPHL